METSPDLINKVLKEIKEIPPLPDVVVKAMQLSRDPDASAQALTDVISQDLALTSNILRLCNSAYYGLPRVVSSLSQAVMYLGFHTIRNLVLTCSLGYLFSPNKKVYGYQQGGLWFHSIACAMASEIICKKSREDLSDTAFTAGLLHDIGQVIMGIKIKDTAETIIELMTIQGFPELEAEQEAVGFTHQELGGVLADKWNFPKELVHSIQYHHNPHEAKSKSILTSIIHIADAVVLDLGLGIELDEMKHPINKFASKAMGLSKKDIEKIQEEAKAHIEECGSTFLGTE